MTHPFLRLFSRLIPAIVVAASAHAQSQFSVSTTPNPLQAGQGFQLTVAGMFLPNATGPTVTSVIVTDQAISIYFNRACEFACGPRGFQVLTASVPAIAAGQYQVSIFEGSSRDSTPPAVTTSISVRPLNFRGLWWKSPAGSESGWGLSIEHQGDVVVAVWFTYDAAGNGMWLVMPRGEKNAQGIYAGSLYRTTGPAFSATPWQPSGVAATPIGSATLSFDDANNGTLAYTIGGVVQSKSITRQIYATPVPQCVEHE